MAYFTDYSTTVPYDTSVTITMSAVANTVADMLVSYAGFTLVAHATEGVASSTSNYAEVSWQTLHVRLYGSSTSNYSLSCVDYYDGATSPSGSANVTFPSAVGAYVSVGMRVIPYKRGKIIRMLNNSSNYATIFVQLMVKSIASGTDYYAVIHNASSQVVSAMPVMDGLSITYYQYPIGNIRDSTATRQVLTQGSILVVSNTTNPSRAFLMQDVYASASMLMTGFVLINSQYFYIEGYYAFEINP